jgi:hypothetical protein
MANHLLNYMYVKRKNEYSRMYILFRGHSLMYAPALVEYDLKMGGVDKMDAGRNLKWDDATITVGYLEYVLRRLNKYSLDRSILNPYKFPNYKDTLKSEEDNLVDYFLYEMRKEPANAVELPEMPMK